MAAAVDLTGRRFSTLVAVSVKRSRGKRPIWTCQCDCGGTILATNGELNAGRKKSCGVCAKARTALACRSGGFGVGGADCVNFKHGNAMRMAHTKEYRAWASMIRRCELPSQQSYPDYGGRGISVCDRWREDFSTFLQDVGRAPSEAHSIDRWPDNDGNYEPGNVRWAVSDEQANNKRNSMRIRFDGNDLTVAEWSNKTGIKYQTLWARIFVQKWPVERALLST